VRLLAALLARRAGASPGTAPAAADVGCDGYEGARGTLRLRGNHVEQPVYLAAADGLEFDVVAQL
jgi:hypothetical protein